MEDSMQVSELFSTINHPQLQDTVKSLEVRSNLDGIKYSEAANHLTSAVSKMPAYQFSRKVSDIQTSGANSGGSGPRKGGRNSGSIYNFQGKLHTSYY